jgi:hypothetical protein
MVARLGPNFKLTVDHYHEEPLGNGIAVHVSV